MNTNLEVGYEKNGNLLVFTHKCEMDMPQRFPAFPWPDMVVVFGFFDDVVTTVHNEVNQFIDARRVPRTVILKVGLNKTLPPGASYLRCANAWLKIVRDLEGGTLTIELHRVPGTYKDFVLLDVLDHLEGRAGRGKNRYVDGRPGVLRQKLDRALMHGPHIMYDPAFRPAPIPAEERVRTEGDWE
jgi:hypothetical protein